MQCCCNTHGSIEVNWNTGTNCILVKVRAFERGCFIRFWSNHYRCSIKKVFLIIFQNPQKNTCARVSFLIKLQAWSIDVCSEAVTQRCSVKKVFLKVSQNSQENSCASLRPATLFKRRLRHRCFPLNFQTF